ncbi:MAG: ATP-binding cassette domain-containing protein [Bacteroidetes bacterium]|nr:ATP-binding cassette domain-containing protein [Bacteroidota bacterium]
MSERILKALMQLFAIIARVDGITTDGRAIVQSFLKQQLNLEQVELYLKSFDEFLEAHHQVSKRKDGSQKRTSVNSVKVLKICTQINAELTQKQKVVVLIRLLEFIHSSYEISSQELEFVTTVADTFNIDEQEFLRCLNFIKSNINDIPDSSKLLVIDNKKENTHGVNTKHIYSEGIGNGQIRVLCIPSVNMYSLYYFGDSDLLLNGQIIGKEKIYILTEGSSIRSSKVSPIYYSDIISAFLSDTSKAKVSFVAHDLEYKFKGGKIGLRDINITEDSGKLIGIMGGSGAGKSTLLNVLNSNEVPSGGAVLINGINIHTQKDKIEGVIGHVSQDDLLIEELTVYQNLFYNAKLCFGNLQDEQISQMVLDLLTSLGLYETKDLKVGSPLEKTISGGQRKRLNIALELIREPSVLFVDEPTSGLSSRDSENIMDLLKELALKGKLVFVVIHQPSSDIFKMFDKLMILDVGGYPIYYGNPVDAVIYFKTIINHVNSNESECPECGNVNPEQIFNIIESKVLDEYGNLTHNRKVSPLEWNKFYKENIEKKSAPVLSNGAIPESTFKIPTKLKQFNVFITRDVKSKLTNSQYLAINLIESPLLAFILAYLVKFYNTDISNKIGYIFRENENITAYLFMCVVVALFIGLTVSAEEIIRDRKILKRESFLNLSRSSYLISKIFVMFVLSAIQTVMFVAMGNWILDINGMSFDYWFVLFTTSCFANMLGLNISASFNSAVTIYILIPFLIIPQLLLSGVIVKFDKLNPSITSQKHVPFTGEIMTSRWAFEALAVNQFKKNGYESAFYIYDKAMSIADFKKNYWIPKLKAKIDKCENIYKNADAKQEVTDDINLLRNELIKENKAQKQLKFANAEQLTIETFSSEKAAELRDYLAKLNSSYIKKYNNASNEKDKLISKRNATPEAKEAFMVLKNNQENESLNDLVRNSNELDKILEKDGELIQRADPIFLDPQQSNFGRAHFFAPRKKFLGKYYDTYWFNISIIWLMSFVLSITLYFDLLRKLINGLEEIVSRITKKAPAQA